MNLHVVLPCVAAAASMLGAWLTFRTSKERDDRPDAYWDPACYCCSAGCGDTDDNNVCIVCGH